MVGVPGKFKGCETCRLRRVKCDNTRPYCKKCRDTGRECAGYERETVFIIGTPQEGGRCSSHPPRVVKSKKTAAGGSGSGNSNANTGSGTVAGSSGASGSGSRSSPKSGNNSRSTSVTGASKSNSPVPSSPSMSIPEQFAGSSGIIPSTFDTSVVSGISTAAVAVASQRTPILLGASPLDLAPLQRGQTAWYDTVPVSRGGIVYHVQTAAISTHLQSTSRRRDSNSRDGSFILSPPPTYTPGGIRPPSSDAEFQLSAQCIMHIAPGGSDASFGSAPSDNICLFLFEYNSPLLPGALPPWSGSLELSNSTRQAGPSRYTAFPGHHFFARVYRPHAIWAALLNGKPTFLSEPEWTAIPWEAHPKSGLDRLLDIAMLLPIVFARAATVMPHDRSMVQRMLAQDLLANGLYVERLLDQWYAGVQEMGAHGAAAGGASMMGSAPPPPQGPGHDGGGSASISGNGGWFWIAGPGAATAAQIPFAETFAFRDSLAAIMFVYYWAILVMLQPCIERMNQTIFEPVLDSYGDSPYPNLPAGMHIQDPAKYAAKEVRQLAANVCRSLDFALSTTAQPDLLTAPLTVVESFYRQINVASGDGTLELLWCEAFRGRLVARGQYLAEVTKNRRWTDVAQF